MDSKPENQHVIQLDAARRDTDHQPDTEELACWTREQLEGALQRLVRSVNTLVYTRNPVALAVTAQQCDRVELLLNELHGLWDSRQAAAVAGLHASIESLLFVEAEGLLAEARRLVSVPLKPVRRADNVILLKPSYADLTDAAFERMLASSDIPQLLSDDYEDWDDTLDYAVPPKLSNKPTLTLVHSSDKPGDK